MDCRLRAGDAQQSLASEQRRRQAQQAAGESNPAASAANLIQSEQADDSARKRTAVCSHGQDGSAAPLFHQGEGAGILDRVSAQCDRHVIAAMFALGANPLVKPPDGGMVEKQRFDGDLEDINEGIQPFDMGQFVGNHGLQLALR